MGFVTSESFASYEIQALGIHLRDLCVSFAHFA
jgi:hypothetical protein